ncbi:MAG: polysaccharide biosynthesis/export family protein [Maribacter arcticus]|uniref:polysaccharide biosynthesis/export family protein n=1 Tax=Maribacter arcticus TaxID=561365 RepID=UPI003001626F
MKNISLKLAVTFTIIILLNSCASKKDVVYFQNALDYETIVTNNFSDNRYKVDDVLSIHISTLDPQASLPFNLYRGSNNTTISPEQVDYIIDREGNIDFPVLGKIKLEGLTSTEVKNKLKIALIDYLKDPIVNIRLKNFTVTILGEVNRPGTYPVNGEQITILEAIGLANDLTIKGMRENIMVIRDFNGTKVYTRIDLTKKDALNSPVYYLTQNDVVYIEPNNSAITSSSLDNRATIALSIASILITSTVLIITRN